MSLRDDLIRHQIALQRLAATEANNIKDYLKRLRDTAKLLSNTQAPDSIIKMALRSIMASLPNTALQSMLDIAEYENKFSIKTFKKYTDQELLPATREALKTALTNTSIGVGQCSDTNGRKLTRAYFQFGNRKSDELTQIIRDSRVINRSNSETDDLIDERVRGLQSTQAKSLAVVAVGFVAVTARALIDAPMIWITALDQDVCFYCEDNHGQLVDDVGYPPAHWGCRCHIEPQLDTL